MMIENRDWTNWEEIMSAREVPGEGAANVVSLALVRVTRISQGRSVQPYGCSEHSRTFERTRNGCSGGMRRVSQSAAAILRHRCPQPYDGDR
jgi:hypothetical protein